jgi:hypothetical protein
MNSRQRSLGRKIDRVMQRHWREAISPEYSRLKKAGDHYTFGLCYAASEAFYHLAGKDGLKPCVGKVDGKTHWWLEDGRGEIIDLTAQQFSAKVRDEFYAAGKGCGFLTREPSRRARAILRHVS